MTTIQTGDDVVLHLHDWSRPKARATVALLHGYGEHAGRYAHVADAFNAADIGVVAADLRGHGRSAGKRGHVDRFADYHLDATAIYEAARARADDGPIFVFGHSMGGLLALDWLLGGAAPSVAGTLISSPYLGIALEIPPLKAAAGKLMSSIWPTLALASGLKGRDVCRDADKQALYDTDQLNNKNATARWFTEALEAHARVLERAPKLATPTLLLYGGDDKVASADATDAFAAKLSLEDREVERLAGYYHELVNEPKADRDAVIGRMVAWIHRHAPSR
jgi:alpha-beta hydrolase superfamily lysophospholipase